MWAKLKSRAQILDTMSELTVADLPRLFARKGRALGALLAANDFAGLETLSKSGVDLLAATNVEPHTVIPGADLAGIALAAKQYGRPVEDFWPAFPGTKHAHRAANIERYATTATARALEAGAIDAVEWALGPTGFNITHPAQWGSWIVPRSDVPMIFSLLAHDGFRLGRELPVATYVELFARGLIDTQMEYFSWDVYRVFVDKLRYGAEDRTDVAVAALKCGLNLGDMRGSFSAFMCADILFALYHAEFPNASNEDFIRSCCDDVLCSRSTWKCRDPKWATPYVDELEYWQIIRDSLTAKTPWPECKCEEFAALSEYARQKLTPGPKNAGAQ